MIVSDGQQRDSAIHTHVPILSSKGISWQERERPQERRNQGVGNRQELRRPLLSLVSSLRLHLEAETEAQAGKCLTEDQGPTGSGAGLGMRRALRVGASRSEAEAGWLAPPVARVFTPQEALRPSLAQLQAPRDLTSLRIPWSPGRFGGIRS